MTDASVECESSVVARLAACLARAIVLLALVVSPWANGSYSFPAQTLLARATSLAVLLTLIVIRRRPQHLRVPTGLAVLVCALLLGCLQILPLPASFIASLSPDLLPIRDSLDGPVSDFTTLSCGVVQARGMSSCRLPRD